MDSKKVIEKLIKIAQTQQKIIEKLAQGRDVDITVPDQPAFPPAVPPAPGTLQPNKTGKKPALVVWEALPPNVKATLRTIELHGDTMKALVNDPKQKTQANYDAILKVMQNLTNSNALQHAYKLELV